MVLLGQLIGHREFWFSHPGIEGSRLRAPLPVPTETNMGLGFLALEVHDGSMPQQVKGKIGA